MPDQEILASFGVQIDESGVRNLQSALERNSALAEEAAAAFGRARASVRAFFRELAGTSLPVPDFGASGVTEEARGLRVTLSPDFTQADRDLAAFRKEAEKAFRIHADASAAVAAGWKALLSLQNLFASSVLPLKMRLQVSGGTGNPSAGAAGAAASARAVLNTAGASVPAVNSTSKTVQAPVSINVTAAGSSPEAVGRSVYDVAEQYLLRTLGAYG